MQISSASSPFSHLLQPNSILAAGHPQVQPISRVTREGGGLVEEEEQAGAEPIFLPKDSVSFSNAALQALQREEAAAQLAASGNDELKAEEEEPASDTPSGAEELTQGEQEQVRKLKARDAEVRAHEAAHAAAAGSLASGGPSYDFQSGPDGVRYAVGGEVGISLGTGNTPEERATNAEQAARAANAPANPSGQDRAVAAQAAQIATSARAEIAKAKQQETSGGQSQAPTAESSAASGTTAPPRGTTEQAGTQAIQKAEQQDARKAQTLQMARRSNAYREISQATTGRSTTA
ncbi:MAG: hypothetical protein JKY61_07825 [Planctomycetes bacterium]|nr:hypothetical protein [Planctomycetota bacterium]